MKKIKKPEASRVFAYVSVLVLFPGVFVLSWKVVALAELAIVLKFTGALPYLTAIITPAWAAVTTVLCFYFNKAKAENTEKIKKGPRMRDY